MEKTSLKKLTLNKEVISRLTNDDFNSYIGGAVESTPPTVGQSCGGNGGCGTGPATGSCNGTCAITCGSGCDVPSFSECCLWSAVDIGLCQG